MKKLILLFIINYLLFTISSFAQNDSITGHLVYDCLDSLPIRGIYIRLIDTISGKTIDSSYTDLLGHYKFNNVKNSTYRIIPRINKTWCPSYPGDALCINRFYLGLYTFRDRLLQTAADVSDDKKINPIDVLMINQRYIKIIHNFLVNDWLCENPVITFNGKSIIQNIRTVCAGDVTASSCWRCRAP